MCVGQPGSRTLGRALQSIGGRVIVLALVLIVLMLAACSSTATGSVSTPLATATPASGSTPNAPTTATSTPTPAAPTATAATSALPPPQLRSTMLFHTFAGVAAHSNTSIVDITCPSGYLLAGGGPTNADPTYVMLWDAPINSTTWRAEVYNTGSTPINAQVNVICFKLSGLQSKIEIATFNNIAPATNSSITDISCPSGYIVSGGGVNIGYTTYTLMENTPESSSLWRGEFYNTSSSQTISAQMQVICLKAPNLHDQIEIRSFNNIPATDGTLYTEISCPSGYLIAGGGVTTGYPALLDQTDAPVSTTHWGVQFYNPSSSPINSQTQFTCFKLT